MKNGDVYKKTCKIFDYKKYCVIGLKKYQTLKNYK